MVTRKPYGTESVNLSSFCAFFNRNTIIKINGLISTSHMLPKNVHHWLCFEYYCPKSKHTSILLNVNFWQFQDYCNWPYPWFPWQQLPYLINYISSSWKCSQNICSYIGYKNRREWSSNRTKWTTGSYYFWIFVILAIKHYI